MQAPQHWIGLDLRQPSIVLIVGFVEPLEGVVDVPAPGEDLGDLVRREFVVPRDQLIEQSLRLGVTAEVSLVGLVIDRETAEAILADADKVNEE